MDRCLNPEGMFFCLSFGLPENRLDKIEDTDDESPGYLAWEVEVHAIPKLLPNPYVVSVRGGAPRTRRSSFFTHRRT